MKQTAVEFLEQELDKNFEIRGNSFLFDKILKQAKEIEKEQSFKIPFYDLDDLSKKLLYKKYPYHPPSETGYWMDMYKEGFQKAIELLTFKSE